MAAFDLSRRYRNPAIDTKGHDMRISQLNDKVREAILAAFPHLEGCVFDTRFDSTSPMAHIFITTIDARGADITVLDYYRHNDVGWDFAIETMEFLIGDGDDTLAVEFRGPEGRPYAAEIWVRHFPR